MKVSPVVAEFLADRRGDGRTDITKLIVAFRNFANAPEKKKEKNFKQAFEYHRDAVPQHLHTDLPNSAASPNLSSIHETP